MIIGLDDSACEDVATSGGKGASLSRLRRSGFPVPPGFVVTTQVFKHFLDLHGLEAEIEWLRDVWLTSGAKHPEKASIKIQNIILSRPLPEELAVLIASAYRELGHASGVAVRSSACAEDSQTASCAGQLKTFLNVRGEREVIARVRDCWTSLFAPSTIFYYRHRQVSLDFQTAVVVQAMLEPARSGVMFTVDPVLSRFDRIIVESVSGLGESVVAGRVTPDHYELHKDSGRIVQFRPGSQSRAVVSNGRSGGLLEVELPPDQDRQPGLSSAQLEDLARLAIELEDCLGGPQDVEWCCVGGRIFLLQSRPVTGK